MVSKRTLFAVASVAMAGTLAFGAAVWAAQAIEKRTVAAVRSHLLTEGFTWAEVSANGLQIWLDGTAPNEAARFRAANIVGELIDTGRIRDRLEVVDLKAPEAPRFSVEMLRNADGLSIIGLMPRLAPEAPELGEAVTSLAGGLPVADMIETANYPAPDGWDEALDFGLKALERLPRSKISVAADRVAITAISDSADEKKRLESDLARLAPAGLRVEMDISAPRPVLTPFTLRLVKDAAGARFDACSADTDRARDRIVEAGVKAGVEGKVMCTVGLGVPTPRWADAAVTGISALAELGAGTITFSDADVTLLAASGVEQATFDRVVGDLQARLPPVFSLSATAAQQETAQAQGPAEFTAALAETGRVELRGRLTNDLQKLAVDSFARSRFGAGAVYTATRTDGELPEGWPVRVIAGLESLAALDQGKLLVRADRVEVTGVTGNPDAKARIAQILSERLGQGQEFKVDVTYDESLDPLAALPTPEDCVAKLNAVMAMHKITFEPGSASIDAGGRKTLEALGAILKDCPGLNAEISGHTDSQGSEAGNLRLSQDRAQAVLIALQVRGLPVEGFTAKGYGEASPIADNTTDVGREANRRIEFSLVKPPAREGTDAPEVKAPDAAAPDVTLSASNAPETGDTASAQDWVADAGTALDEGGDEAPMEGDLVSAGGDAVTSDTGPVAAIQTAPDPASQDVADAPLVMAAVPAEPALGLTRSISIGDDAAAADDGLTFQPTTETFPRPQHRP